MKNEKNEQINENEIEFKRVLRGFDPDEVRAYIDEMNRSMQDVSKNYETRMAEMKQELTLVNREKENLREKCAQLEANPAPAPAEPEPEPQPEPEKPKRGKSQQAQIDALKKQLDEEKAVSAAADERLRQSAEQVEELNEQLRALKQELSENQELVQELERAAEDSQPVRAQYEASLAEIEKLKAGAASYQEEAEMLRAESKATAEHLKKTEEENTSLKTELSRLNVENSILQEKNGQYRKELSDMKTEAKSKAYDYAEKLSAGEDALRQEQMRLTKKLQMQTYHIEQAESAVNELKKQLEQIKFSFDE